jgi:hypothetical protein
MIRALSLALLVSAAVLLADSSARGQLPVAPPPREVRPDGSRDPAPPPEPPAKPEDPAAVVDRSIRNAKEGGDMPKNDSPMGNMGMGSKQDGMPMGGTGDQEPMGGSTGRRPRMGEPNQKKQPDQPKEQPEPKEQKKGGQPKENNDAKNPGGVAGGNPGGQAKAAASLPFSEDVAKDVWGHLPDKLRRQMTQYYKEDVMPKYSELLRLYYSSLSEESPGATTPRK